MAGIIVAFPKIEDGRNIRNILTRSGFQVSAVCTSGAQVLNQADSLGSGIVVCGYRLADMLYTDLYENLPRYFELLLVASRTRWGDERQEGIICVPMPLKVRELTSALAMMEEQMARRRRQRRRQPAARSQEDQSAIDEAKAILMERNNMSEAEAHRYIQKCSMDSGNDMAETARMIAVMMNGDA